MFWQDLLLRKLCWLVFITILFSYRVPINWLFNNFSQYLSTYWKYCDWSVTSLGFPFLGECCGLPFFSLLSFMRSQRYWLVIHILITKRSRFCSSPPPLPWPTKLHQIYLNIFYYVFLNFHIGINCPCSLVTRRNMAMKAIPFWKFFCYMIFLQ